MCQKRGEVTGCSEQKDKALTPPDSSSPSMELSQSASWHEHLPTDMVFQFICGRVPALKSLKWGSR